MENLSTLQRALYTVKQLKQTLKNKDNTTEPIAIIGLACRFPGAPNKAAFWQFLEKGHNAITPLPPERLALLKGTCEFEQYCSEQSYWGSYLPNIEWFDPYFFGITPREAILMDPQQRLLLEVTYEAFEDAGLSLQTLAKSKTGVFIGMYGSEYMHLQATENPLDALYLPTGNALSMAANRLSYQFDLQGPSFTIDTACSSSLVALHLACTSLQNKHCQLAVVGSARINLLPSVNALLMRASFLSPDGQCKAFDAKANGYVQGEGAGVLILKPLSNAMRDHDRIYAVIAGSAINQDGHSNGLTAPNGAQQEAVLRAAYQASQIDPQHVSYIECHGTGTVLGDPIELEAIEQVIGKGRRPDQPCWIGSVKTNIGHLEPAAGIAGLIKLILSLQQKKLPPHLNITELNPHVPFGRYHLKIPRELQHWPLYGDYRVAGISSFGFGGTNAHLVIREFSPEAQAISLPSVGRSPAELFTLSAKNTKGLQSLITQWIAYLKNPNDHDLGQLCYHLHIRRTHYPCRLAIVVQSIRELHESLSTLQQDNKSLSSPNMIFIQTPNKKESRVESKQSLTSLELPSRNLTEIAEAYVDGKTIDWVHYESHRHYPVIDLPSYLWERQPYWSVSYTNIQRTSKEESYPLQGKKVKNTSDECIFEFALDIEKIPELKDTYHIVHIGFYLEMLAFITQDLTRRNIFKIENLSFLSMIKVIDNSPVIVTVVLKKQSLHVYSFSFYTVNIETKEWREHALGIIITQPTKKTTIKPPSFFEKAAVYTGNAEDFANKIRSMNMPMGRSIQWTKHFWIKNQDILAEFENESSDARGIQFCLHLHPGLFDACVQPLFMLIEDGDKSPYMVNYIRSFTYLGAGYGPFYLYAQRDVDGAQASTLGGRFLLMDSTKKPLAVCDGLIFTRLNNKIEFRPTVERLSLVELAPHERKEKLLDFLQRQIAAIFAMPLHDINHTACLQDLGMDSIMALALMNKIHDGLALSLSIEELLMPVSIQKISDKLLHLLLQSSSDKENTMITVSDKQKYLPYSYPKKKAILRLFCFPYGGGGASLYQQWIRFFSDHIEICPVQLPGRETLHDMDTVQDINELVPLLYRYLVDEMTVPFGFFGHSFGGLVSFELARYIRKQGSRAPAHLFVSAYPAPQLPFAPLRTLIDQLKQLPFDVWKTDVAQLSDEQLQTVAKIISVTSLSDIDMTSSTYVELFRLMLPRYLADIHLVENYHYTEEPPLDLPITVFCGTQDIWASQETLHGWHVHTTQQFQLHNIDGEHLFINEKNGRRSVIQEIEKIVLPEKKRTKTAKTKAAYIFPGQGSQHKGMGADLFTLFPECVKEADTLLGYSTQELCIEDPQHLLNQTEYTQPMLYVVSVLTYLKKIKETNRKPDFVAGHSLGEYSALFAAGAFDFVTGLQLVKKRGELMTKAKGGGMAAVIGLTDVQVYTLLETHDLNDLTIANYNTPLQNVISGSAQSIREVASIFTASGAVYVPLPVSGAFHSNAMIQAQQAFECFIQDLTWHNLTIPVISNVTARPHELTTLPKRLSEQIVRPVQWVNTVTYLKEHGVEHFEELGPGRVLSKLIDRIESERFSNRSPLRHKQAG